MVWRSWLSRIKGFIPYILIIVFTGITRFYNLHRTINLPGYSGSLGTNGADEGIFLMTAKLISSGYEMYTDVNTQQGPLFSYIFSILEGDPVYIRAITAALAIIGVLVLIMISERFGNRRIAVLSSIFLTANFLFFKESRHASFDLYSTTFMILGFFSIMVYFERMDSSSTKKGSVYMIPLITTGLFFSMAAMSKLFAVIPLISLGIYMLISAINEKDSGEERRTRMVHISVLVVASVIPTLFMMSLFGFQETLKGILLDNMNRPYMSIREKALTTLLFLFYTSVPLVLAFISARREFRDRNVQLMLVWAVPLSLFIFIQSPIWEHYFLMIVPPICYLGGRGFELLIRDRNGLETGPLDKGPISKHGRRDHIGSLKNIGKVVAGKGPLITLFFVLGIVYILTSAGFNTALVLVTEDPVEKEIADDLEPMVEEEEFIISGDPIIGIYADRLQPPEATNLAKVRHPELTDMDIVNVTCSYNVSAVVLTYHLSNYQLYIEFLDTYYDFHGAYRRPHEFSDLKGEIEVGKETFTIYTRNSDVNLTLARQEFFMDHFQNPPSSQGR